MAGPFYAEFFSWTYAVALALPALYTMVARRSVIYLPHAAISPMVALLLLHAVALKFSGTPFETQVIKDLLIAFYLLAIYSFADEKAAEGFFLAVIPVGFISACLGLVKAALLDRGYLLGFILESCNSYPAGSALCVNYNNLGMLWLVAALGCISKRWWPLLPILLAAGALSSSRRFLVLMVLLPFIWILIQGKFALIRSALVAIATGFLVFFVSDPVSFKKFQFGEQAYSVIFQLDGPDADVINTPINRSSPSVILGTLADGTVGTASRFEYWKLAYTQLSWLPQGWNYHRTFACTFSPCTDFHYPHMSILSEWIIGGALFGAIAIAFYAWPAWSVWRQKSVAHIALLMLAMPYSLISGDTVFSLPLYLACMFIALSSIPRRINSYQRTL